MKVKGKVMVSPRMDDGGSEQMRSDVRPIFSFYEHTDEQFEPIQEEYFNLFAEENSLPVASPICGDFEEVFGPQLYDEYEDSCSKEEGLKWDVSSFVSNLESLYQEELISLGFVEDVPYEMEEGNQGLE